MTTMIAKIPSGLTPVTETDWTKLVADNGNAKKLFNVLLRNTSNEQDRIAFIFKLFECEETIEMDMPTLAKNANEILDTYNKMKKSDDVNADMEAAIAQILLTGINEEEYVAKVAPQTVQQEKPKSALDLPDMPSHAAFSGDLAESPVIVFPMDKGNVNYNGITYSVTFRFFSQLPLDYPYHEVAFAMLGAWDKFFKEGKQYGITHVVPEPYYKSSSQAPQQSFRQQIENAPPKTSSFGTSQKTSSFGTAPSKPQATSKSKAAPVKMQKSPDAPPMSLDTAQEKHEAFITKHDDVKVIFAIQKQQGKNAYALDMLNEKGEKVFTVYLNDSEYSVQNKLDGGHGELWQAINDLKVGSILMLGSPLWLTAKQNEKNYWNVNKILALPTHWRLDEPYY